MFCPELIIAEPGGAAVGQRGGGQQGKDGAAEEPEIADVKQQLGLADDHVAAENGGPAADGDGQMIHRIGAQRGHAHQPPVVAHLRADQRKGQHIADGLLMLPAPEPSGIFADQKNRGQHQQNGCQMRRGKQEKLLGFALSKEIAD